MPKVSDCAEPRRSASESRRLTGRPVHDTDDADDAVPQRESLMGRSGVLESLIGRSGVRESLIGRSGGIGVARMRMGALPHRLTSGLKVKVPVQEEGGLVSGLAGHDIVIARRFGKGFA